MTQSIATVEGAPRALQTLPAGGAQAELLSELVQALIGALMQGVDDAANLSVATVRALLAPADGTTKAELQRLAEAWQFSWRTCEICATTAANVMRLTAAHERSGFERSLKIFERETGSKPLLDQTTIAELRAAFEGLRTAQAHAFESAIQTHRCLVGLARGRL
jgi:hypothetical protein